MISVVIPFFNNIDDLDTAVESLGRSTIQDELRVIVVDNSTDEAAREHGRRLCRQEGFTYEEIGYNAGFAAACNRGIARAGDDYVFLLNQDAMVHPETLEHLLAHLADNPRTAAVSPAIVTESGDIWFAGGRYRRWIGRVTLADFGKPWKSGPARPTGFLSGSAGLYRTSAVRDVGGFDERYFLYYEDVDLSQRLNEAGWTLAVLPSVRVVHRRGRHGDPLRNLSPTMLTHTVRSRILFGLSRRSFLERFIATLTVPLEALRLAFHATRARPKDVLASWRSIGRGFVLSRPAEPSESQRLDGKQR